LSPPPSLARQNTRLLAAAFILIELLVAGALIAFLILPLAQRSADDLAGLMMLSAQTWAELPPQTRADFEAELLAGHSLALRAEPPGTGRDEWHPPYFYLLEDALARRTGVRQHLVREDIGGQIWYWISLPAGGGKLAVGLSQQRVGARPGAALLVTLLGGLAIAGGLAVWLARRITVPLARLEEMARHVGQGEEHIPLPETGPRELAALARRFNEMSQQVRDLLSARTTLLAGVSHDLRTPLARMYLALEMLKTHPTPALIARLENDVEQMDRLIGNVLELARGLGREQPVKLDMAELLDGLAEDFSTPANSIVVHCPPCLRPAPRLALHRALTNLLQNAQRHAPNAPVELVCALENEHCRIGVLDHGPGIPPDQIEAMFQPFQRLETSRSPATGGTGLGLAIVRELARANGWQVSLANRPEGGLAAWITLADEGREKEA
jgi:two-component system osmolarity sensor histidine kinase EnvZ